MSLWTMIFLVAICGMAYAAWNRHQETKQGVVRDMWGNPVADHAADRARESEMARELAELRERVKVLERIATEDRESLNLAREIEQLRDERSKSE
tara:strand:- start:34385 stop:34669 length:285 start_codon:yes stop_codon:yes gene_type:complete